MISSEFLASENGRYLRMLWSHLIWYGCVVSLLFIHPGLSLAALAGPTMPIVVWYGPYGYRFCFVVGLLTAPYLIDALNRRA
jgi:hypothetical protein